MTQRTKKFKRLYFLVRFLSAVVTLSPIIVYGCIAFFSNDVASEKKATFGILFICAVFLVLINIIMKNNLRSPLFMVILGIYVALSNITTLLILLSLGTILDEFLLCPLYKSLKNKFTINKEIDMRE